VKMDVLILSFLGFAVTAILLFLLIRNLEAVIFWAALCAPAIGTSLVAALGSAIGGDYTGAMDKLKLLPFFIASLDSAFFASPSDIYFVVGIGFLIIWMYIMAHYAVKKFGMWALPIVPIIVWGVGLTLPNLRLQLMELYPSFGFLFDFYGIPFLVLMVSAVFGICYLVWRKGYTIQKLPMYIPSTQKVK